MPERVGEARIPLARPRVGAREEELVLEVLRSGRLSLGPMLDRFERDFARRLGVTDAVAVSSGTAALHLGVRELGWGRGDRIVTTPLSFIASCNCLLYEGAEPLFCDVDPATLCLDPAAVSAAADDQGVAGILPVHIFGRAAAIAELESIAAERGHPLLEDCAQALGALDDEGRAVGSRGNPAAFAFYANKQMTTGEGGVLVPASVGGGERARSDRNQGRSSDMRVMDHPRVGFNYRLTDVAAAIGVAQLERLEGLLDEREALATSYRERLTSIGGVEPGAGDPDDLVLPLAAEPPARLSHFVYLVRLPVGADRDEVIGTLDRAGVDSRPYLPCIHTQPAYRERFGDMEGACPVAEEFSRRALALPFFPGLGEAEVERVCAGLATALGRSGFRT